MLRRRAAARAAGVVRTLGIVSCLTVAAALASLGSVAAQGSGVNPIEPNSGLYATVRSDTTATVSDANPVALAVGSATVVAHGEAMIDVTLHTDGQPIVAVLNDIAFDDFAAIAEEAMAATSLADGVGEEDLRVDVVDASQLPDSGFVRVDAEVIAYESKTANQLVVAARGENGTAPAAHAAGAAVLLLTALPDCQGSPALEKAGKTAVFSFLPDGCSPGVDCTAVRAVVISFENVTAIPDGTTLYSCQVQAGGEGGSFPLACPFSQVATPAGEMPPVECTGGEIVVIDQQTPTPTATAIPTPTPILRCGDCDRDGCVLVNEVVFVVGVALGRSPVEACPPIDRNGDRAAGIDELIASVENSMAGCIPALEAR